MRSSLLNECQLNFGRYLTMVSKMLRFTFTVGLAIAVLTISVTAEELYSSEFDSINIHELLHNDTVRHQYYDCFYGSAECLTPAAKFYKVHLPEAIVTKCRKCTEKQKEHLDALSTWYVQNSPKEWNDLIAKFIEDSKKPRSGH